MGYTKEDRETIKAGGLSRREKSFAESYIVDFNATAALLRLDPNTSSPGIRASLILKRERVRKYIDSLLFQRAQKMKVDAEWVLNAAVELYNKCMANVEVKDTNGIPMGLYRFDSRGANAALNTIGKHVGVQAFKQLVEHTGTDGGPMVFWGNQSQSQPKKRRPPQPPRRKN
ncbi:MAG: terminase small subunit [Methylococcaceae bacterium]